MGDNTETNMIYEGVEFEEDICEEPQSEDDKSVEKIESREMLSNLNNVSLGDIDLTAECLQTDKLEPQIGNGVLGSFIGEIVEKTNEDIFSYDGSEDNIQIPLKEKGDSTKSTGGCCKLLIIITFTTIWLSFLVYCYLYLTTVCVPVELWCPNPTHTFSSQACCSSLWLNLGSTVGLGNECTIDMADMEAGCPMYDCYKNDSTAELNVNGCSYVPNTLFNEIACNIHDLCYITPGSTKKLCDDTFVENIILIYCDNVNIFERIACRGRAQLAGAVVSAIDSFYNDSEELRENCHQTGSSLAILTGMLATLFFTVISACFIHLIVKRLRTKELIPVEDEIDYSSEYQLERISEANEPICYCDEPMENCNVCDEVFIKDLSLECDINEVLAEENCIKERIQDIEYKKDTDFVDKADDMNIVGEEAQ